MVWRGTGHENVGVARLDSAGGDDRAASAAPQLAWPGADIRGLTVFLRMHPAHQRRRDGPLSPRSGGHARIGTAGTSAREGRIGTGTGHVARERIGPGWPTPITSIRDGALISAKLQFWALEPHAPAVLGNARRNVVSQERTKFHPGLGGQISQRGFIS